MQIKMINHTGEKMVLENWIKYFSEFEAVTQAGNDMNSIVSWREDNIFMALIDRNTGELSYIRCFKDNKPSVNELLIKFNKIPMFTHIPPKSTSELRNMVNNVLNLFNDEMESIGEQTKLPVLLTEYCGYSNYKGVSLRENKELFIYDYKSYANNFAYSHIDNTDPNDIKDNDRYVIIVPSIKLISALGLNLNPEIWEVKQKWDKWVPREKKESNISLIPDECKELYEDCLNAVNKSRANNLGLGEEFSLLETRLYRFEKLLKLSVPSIILNKEVDNLRKSYEKVKNVL